MMPLCSPTPRPNDAPTSSGESSGGEIRLNGPNSEWASLSAAARLRRRAAFADALQIVFADGARRFAPLGLPHRLLDGRAHPRERRLPPPSTLSSRKR